jgi:hypothetical protein
VTKKISELPLIPGPGDGSETVPVNQNGVTYQSSMLNLLAWMNLSGVIASDGTVDAPGLAWGSETTMGWYRRGAGQTAYAVNGKTVELMSGDANGQYLSVYPQKDAGRTQFTLHDNLLPNAVQHQLYLLNQSSSYVLGENLLGGAASVPFTLAFPAGVNSSSSITAPGFRLSNVANAFFGADANHTYLGMSSNYYFHLTFADGVLTWATPAHGSAFQTYPSGDVVSGRSMYFGGTGQMSVRQDAGERALWFAPDGWRLRWLTSNGTLQYLSYTGALLFGVDGSGNFSAPGINGTSYNYATHVRGGGGNATAGLFNFNWYDDGSAPGYLWGSSDAVNMRVYPPSRLSVNYANNSGYSNNSGQVSGIGGWSYANWANNPVYIWCTEGDGQSQHLTQPGNLSVGWAGRVGTVEGSSGGTLTSDFAVNGNMWSNNGFVRAASGFRCREAAYGTEGGNVFNFFWNSPSVHAYIDSTYMGAIWFASDERIKQRIFPLDSDREAFLKIKPIRFGWKDISLWRDDGKEYWGWSAQNLATCIPKAITGDFEQLTKDGEIQPATVDERPILVLTVLEVQALIAEVAELRARVLTLEAS